MGYQMHPHLCLLPALASYWAMSGALSSVPVCFCGCMLVYAVSA